MEAELEHDRGGGREASFRNPELQAIFGITLMAVLGVSSIAPALPKIAMVLDVGAAEVGLLITAFTFPGVLLSTVSGVLADRYGRLPVLLPGLVLFALAGVACCFATDLTTLLVLRVLQGIGASPVGTVNVILIGDLFSGRQRTAAMGFNASVLSIGTAAYPAIGGALAMLVWSAPFALALLALPVAFMAVRRLKSAPLGHDSDLGDYFVGVFSIFRRAEVVVLFLSSSAIFVLLYGAYVTFLPFLMAIRFDASALGIGVMMAGVSCSTAVTAANLGRLAARFGRSRVLAGGFVVFAVALAGIPLAPTVVLLSLPAILLGSSFATTIPVVQVLLAEIAPADRRGAVLSFNGTVLRLGQTLGPPVMAAVERFAGIDAVFHVGAGLAIALAGLSAFFVKR